MFDIDPGLYGQSARKRRLIVAAVAILGICNGMQLLAVCLGGELVQDVQAEFRARSNISRTRQQIIRSIRSASSISRAISRA
nr:gamma-glutamyl-gamma-aminobutyrate hydrolase family protein [Sinorhizobium fredii]